MLPEGHATELELPPAAWPLWHTEPPAMSLGAQLQVRWTYVRSKRFSGASLTARDTIRSRGLTVQRMRRILGVNTIPGAAVKAARGYRRAARFKPITDDTGGQAPGIMQSLLMTRRHSSHALRGPAVPRFASPPWGASGTVRALLPGVLDCPRAVPRTKRVPVGRPWGVQGMLPDRRRSPSGDREWGLPRDAGTAAERTVLRPAQAGRRQSAEGGGVPSTCGILCREGARRMIAAALERIVVFSSR